MLDDRVAGDELVEASYAVESEAYAEEINDFVKEGSVCAISSYSHLVFRRAYG